jgi:hypothetical protein
MRPYGLPEIEHGIQAEGTGRSRGPPSREAPRRIEGVRGWGLGLTPRPEVGRATSLGMPVGSAAARAHAPPAALGARSPRALKRWRAPRERLAAPDVELASEPPFRYGMQAVAGGSDGRPIVESSIEWTDATWNPVTGCTKIRSGCKHCYAERMARRLQAMGKASYADGFAVTIHPAALEVPLRWRNSRRVFVNSMSDLFHEDVPAEFIQRVFGVMNRSPQHVFQVQTKRPETALACAPKLRFSANIWMGVTAENREAVPRTDVLRQIPARVRFLSVEPLLEALPPASPRRHPLGDRGRRVVTPCAADAGAVGEAGEGRLGVGGDALLQAMGRNEQEEGGPPLDGRLRARYILIANSAMVSSQRL